MADWNTAYNWMMDFEDAPRACAQVPDAAPSGVAGPCYAISGINSGAWPAEFAAIAALAPGAARAAGPAVLSEPLLEYTGIAQMVSDEVCKRVFDFAVNGGSGTSVRCLQQAVNSLLSGGRHADRRGWRLGPDDAGRGQCGRSGGASGGIPGQADALLPGHCRRRPA